MEESLFSYGYNDKKSKVLYSAGKDIILNAIISTCFKKHFHEGSYGLFFYLLPIRDRKEKINQYRENVNLNPIDCFLELMSSISPDKVNFKPYLLNSGVAEKRALQVELLYHFFRPLAETSNVKSI